MRIGIFLGTGKAVYFRYVRSSRIGNNLHIVLLLKKQKTNRDSVNCGTNTERLVRGKRVIIAGALIPAIFTHFL